MAREARAEDTWRVCIICSCYEPFQDMTDICCRTERGVACIFPPQGRRGGTDARERARGPPQGSRSRNRNLNTVAAAAHQRAERAAEGAAAAAREAEGAAARAAMAAAEARAAAGAARIHASVAQADRNAAAAARDRPDPGWFRR